MDQEKVGKFIKQIRVENNLSQKDFASILGVTFQAVSKWENGKNLPDMAILKDISDKFDVDINELINGEKIIPKKSKKNIIFGIIIAILVIIGVLFLVFNNHKKNEYEFNELVTTSDDFTIYGSVVKTSDRTSLIITKVNYTGDEDDTVYEKLSCNLYEEDEKNKNKLSSCDEDENKTLIEYLSTLKIKMDHYANNCSIFTNSQVFIEISVKSKNNKTTIYKIPIVINESNC